MKRESFLSAGIDIGTSTTHLIISRLTTEVKGGFGCVPTVEITSKEILYSSDILLTPLLADGRINGKAVLLFLREEYRKAGMTAADLKSGAVIITGESARRENARQVLSEAAAEAGGFIVAEAGGITESVLAGRGALADRLSVEKGVRVANVDIGGGTTNTAVFFDGEPIAASCIGIGGRLVKLRRTRAGLLVTDVSEKLRPLLEREKISLTIGERLTRPKAEHICSAMAHAIEQELKRLPNAALYSFSGGVAETVGKAYDDPFCFGDLGILLGKALENSDFFRTRECRVAPDAIRATVVGAGNYSVDLSGSTIFYRNCVFPYRNIPCVHLKLESRADLDAAFRNADLKTAAFDGGDIAFAFRGYPSVTAKELMRIAEKLCELSQPFLKHGAFIAVVTEADIAKALGILLRRVFPADAAFLCADGLSAFDGAYLDFGEPVAGGIAIPAAVRQLIFREKEGEVR